METIQPLEPVNYSPVMEVKAMPTFSYLWNESWQFIGKNLLRLVFVAIICIVLNLLSVIPTFGLAFLVDSSAPFGTLYGLSVVTMIVSVVCSIFTFTLFSLTAIHGKSLALSEILKRSFTLLWPMTVMLFMVYAMVLAGFLVFIIPGIVLSVSLMPVLWIVLEERLSIKEAIDRSISLVSGRWWEVAGHIGLVILVVIGLSLVALIVAALLSPLLFTFSMFSGMGTVLAGVFLMVVGYVALATLMGFFVARYIYMLYRGLVISVVPQSKQWWQGLPLTILMVIGSLLILGYMAFMPYLTVIDMQETPLPHFPAKEENFKDWIKNNPDFFESSKYDQGDGKFHQFESI